MGVLDRLKARMSGPAQTDMSSPVYGFDTGRKPSSGVEAVNAGLAAAANQVVSQSTVGQDVANLGATIGSAIGTAYGKDKEEKKDKKPKTIAKRKISKKRKKELEKSGINTDLDINVSDNASIMTNDSRYA